MADSTAELQALLASVTKLTHEVSNLTREFAKNAEEVEKLRDAEEANRLEIEEETQLLKDKHKLSEQEARDIAKLNKQYRDATKRIAELSNATNKTANTQVELAKETRKQSIAQKALSAISKKTGIDLSALSNSTSQATKSVNFLGAAVTWVIGGLMRQRQIMKEQITANAGLIEGTDLVTGLMNQQAAAWMRGVEPAVLGRIMAGNRQMVNAMGGISNTLQVLDPAMDRFFGMTMDLEESMLLAAEQMTRFANLGVKPTREAMLKYTKDVEEMARITGMSAAQIGAYFAEIESDTEMMHLLRAAREGERESIIANQRALVLQNQALGMTADQAKEAAKMLNKMVAAKPLDRMKQAARVRALGAAMGISGAEGAAAAIQAGPRASAAQKEQLRDFSVAAAGAADAMRGAGLGSEIFVDTLLDKLDLQEYLGKGSPMSTSLGDVLKEGEKMRGSYTKAADSALVKAEQTVQVLQKILGAVIDGSLIMNMIVTGFKTIWNALTGGAVTNWIYEGLVKAIPNFMEGFGKVFGTIVDALTGGIEAIYGRFLALIGKILSKVPMLGDVGRSLGDVGSGMMENASEKGRRIASTWSSPGTTAVAPAPTSRQTDSAAQTQAASATVAAANGINKQLAKMDENTTFLKTIAELTQKQITLAEKQLAATTLTEAEKKEGIARGSLLGGTSMSSSYGRLQ